MGPPVSTLILNYNATAEALKRCVASVDASNFPDLTEILIVDNGSTQHVRASKEVAAAFPRVRLIEHDHNYGFAGGINRGVAACRGKWVFLLNNDTEVEPGALSACASVLARQDENCMGVAPKLLFLEDPSVIDAVGNGIDAMGTAVNIGIGQIDVGQYNRVERSFGPCFAAGLFRKAAFDDDHVGPLDESYFMYYEDVDWNWRANVFGYTFFTAPDARVYHRHSGQTRKLDHSYKFRLIERNLLATALKNCEGRRAAVVWSRRMVTHARSIACRRYAGATVQAVVEALARLPDTLAKRRAVSARRVVHDAEIVQLAHGERSYYDPTTYRPHYTLANLAAMYRRKALVTGDRRWLDVVGMARALDRSCLRYEPDLIAARLLPLLQEEPQSVHDFVRKIGTVR